MLLDQHLWVIIDEQFFYLRHDQLYWFARL